MYVYFIIICIFLFPLIVILFFYRFNVAFGRIKVFITITAVGALVMIHADLIHQPVTWKEMALASTCGDPPWWRCKIP